MGANDAGWLENRHSLPWPAHCSTRTTAPPGRDVTGWLYLDSKEG
jgi:hypothetical protein